ncbi:cadherin-23-like [Tachypleus tridentatus]|uniref:cadherin-23-like n=1 Tax=Tachypleus tridentatus TaxID=6853 RepID=UPI003FD5906E
MKTMIWKRKFMFYIFLVLMLQSHSTRQECLDWCSERKVGIKIWDDHKLDIPVETITIPETVEISNVDVEIREGKSILESNIENKKVMLMLIDNELHKKDIKLYLHSVTITGMKSNNNCKQSCYVTVKVDPANHYPPYFVFHKNKFLVPENENNFGEIVKLEAKDDDKEPINKITNIYIKDDNSLDDKFKLQWEKGSSVASLVLNNPLDYETKQFYRIEVVAEDTGRNSSEPPKTGSTIIFIDVEDKDDNGPIFTKVCSVTSIPEMEDINTHVFDVKAEDGDYGIRNTIKYSFGKSNTATEFFKIDDNGDVSIKKKIDREDPELELMSNPMLVLSVKASEWKNEKTVPNRSKEIPCTIIVEDINDNAPMFNHESYNAVVRENTQKNIPVEFQSESFVTDLDMGDNAAFSLELLQEDNIFEVMPSLGMNKLPFLIRVNDSSKLKYDCSKECTKKVFELQLTATETKQNINGDYGSDVAVIKISMQDENDHFPEFGDIEEASISENASAGDVVTQINATDKDMGAYGTEGIRYSLVSGSFLEDFSIDYESGILTVKTDDHKLDREKVPDFYITIKAQDDNGRGNSNNLRLKIILIDANDNDPYFVNNDTIYGYKAFVWEGSAKNSFLKNILAKDDDEYNDITYSLKENCDKYLEVFSLGETSGELKVIEEIDYEKNQTMNFTVTATDSGTPSRSTSTWVFLEIGDVNDNDPKFTDTTYTLEVDEEVNITGRLTVTATDEDSNVYGNFGLVNYRIPGGTKDSEYFSVHSETGAITNRDRLDRENQEKYQFIVEAFDNPQNPNDRRKSTAQVFVTLRDINDNKPEFEKWDACVEVPETTTAGFQVKTVKATDKDKGDNGYVQYTINSNGEIENLFEIDSETGMITVRGSLLNLHRKFNISVLAEDKGKPPLSSVETFCIFVQDVNLNTPKFVKSQEKIYIQEDEPEGYSVTKVTAEDKDSPLTDNSKIRYEICSDCEEEKKNTETFSIDENTGVIRLKGLLNKARKSNYTLFIKACDKGNPPLCTHYLDSNNGHAEIQVYVRNKQDKLPQFRQRTGEVHIIEETLEGRDYIPEAIYQEEFNENTENQLICYFIIGGDEEYFKLDKMTRELTLKKKLDRESIPFHDVIVKAQENCDREPDKVFEFNLLDLTTIKITVNVIDINDNPPKFTDPRFTGGVKVTDKYEKMVVQVSANDPDEGENAVVFYKLNSDFKMNNAENIEEIKAPFYVNKTTGEVILNFHPKSNMKGHFDFDVMAYDHDNLNSITKVLIYLLRGDQQLHIILKIPVDGLKQEMRMKLKRSLEDIISEIVIIDDYNAYAGDDNRYNPEEYTDVYIHVVRREDNSVMEVVEALKLFDKYWGKVLELRKEDFYIVLIDKIGQDDVSDSWEKKLKFILFGVLAGLALAFIVLLLVSCMKISSLSRKLRAANATSFGSQDSGLNRIGINDPPNTNKHAVEGSNPMWNQQEDLNYKPDDVSMDGSEDSFTLQDFENKSGIGGKENFGFMNYPADPVPNTLPVPPTILPTTGNKSISEKEIEALGLNNPLNNSQKNKINALKSTDSKWRYHLNQETDQVPPPYDANKRNSVFNSKQTSFEL